MSLSQGIRNTIVNNRGKLGALAGVGSTIAAQNYIKENPDCKVVIFLFWCRHCERSEAICWKSLIILNN